MQESEVSPVSQPRAPIPKPKPKTVRVLIVTAGVILLGVLAAGALYVVDQGGFGTLAGKQDQQVIEDIVTHLSDYETVQFVSDVRVQGEVANLLSGNSRFSLAGEVVNNTDAVDDFRLDYSIVDGSRTAISVTNFSLLRVGDETYFQVGGLEALPFFGAVASGDWIDATENFPRTTASANLSLLEKYKLKETIVDSGVVTVEEELGVEVINGEETTGYSLVVHEEKVQPLVRAISEQVYGNTPTAQDEQSVKKILDALNVRDVKVWVGSDKRVYRLEGTFDTTGIEGLGSATATVSTDFDYSNTGALEAPKEATRLSEALGAQGETIVNSVLGSVLPGVYTPNAATNEPDAAAEDSDGDGLTDEEEATYGTDPASADSDGDGFSDGAEVDNGFSPVGPGLL